MLGIWLRSQLVDEGEGGAEGKGVGDGVDDGGKGNYVYTHCFYNVVINITTIKRIYICIYTYNDCCELEKRVLVTMLIMEKTVT
jgi:hypothetical protein